MVDRASATLPASIADDLLARDLEHVEGGTGAEVEDRHARVVRGGRHLEGDLGAERVAVEGHGPVHVSRQGGDVVEAGGDGHRTIIAPGGRPLDGQAAQRAAAPLTNRSPSRPGRRSMLRSSRSVTARPCSPSKRWSMRNRTSASGITSDPTGFQNRVRARRVRRWRPTIALQPPERLRGVEVDVATLLAHDPAEQLGQHRMPARWASRP